MTEAQERRDPGMHRVTVSTLVEICGNVPGTPVFEAESVDVSPRGMHLRTAYLPEADVPVICRFDNDGTEIVVEGVVAWRRERGRGGEFGVRFTALDSRSVDALRGLCKAGSDDKHDKAGAAPAEALGEPGSRVRLHIDGLGSPMKARVKTGSVRKVQVGSSLEFLKVGRKLEIEDLEQGARRGALIDTVNVIIDPSTQIPQLVVGLRYEGAEDTTPSPTAAPVGGSEPEARSLRIPASAVTVGPAPRASAPVSAHASAAEEKRADQPRADAKKAIANASTDKPAEARTTPDDDEPALRGRVATLAASAEVKAKAASEKLAQASSTAARGAAGWLRDATSKIVDIAQLARKNGSAAPRRTTSPAPNSVAHEKPRLRAQNGAGAVASTAKAPFPGSLRSRRTALIAGGGVVATLGLVFALSGGSSAPPGAVATAASATAVAAGDAVAPGPAGAMPASAAANGVQPGGAVIANVPLFGPTPLTTTEPAPLGPPPGAETEEGRERLDARASLAAATQEQADERWPDEASSRKSSAEPEPDEQERPTAKATRPEDVSPWGRGKMHEPTIHRLRLDGPGGALQGAVEPTGFTIVVPSRKVMEAAAGIAKRDPRIARVRATNASGGAQVSFRFKDGVPSYRVRLRRDYIEFLISAPVKDAKSKTKQP